MVRAAILSAWISGSVGLVGYGLEIIVHREATPWTYVLTGFGVVGLVTFVGFKQWLTRGWRQ